VIEQQRTTVFLKGKGADGSWVFNQAVASLNGLDRNISHGVMHKSLIYSYFRVEEFRSTRVLLAWLHPVVTHLYKRKQKNSFSMLCVEIFRSPAETTNESSAKP
jgi:hypothetical protein